MQTPRATLHIFCLRRQMACPAFRSRPRRMSLGGPLLCIVVFRCGDATKSNLLIAWRCGVRTLTDVRLRRSQPRVCQCVVSTGSALRGRQRRDIKSPHLGPPTQRLLSSLHSFAHAPPLESVPVA